jgi:hypothetical protein
MKGGAGEFPALARRNLETFVGIILEISEKNFGNFFVTSQNRWSIGKKCSVMEQKS